MLSDKYIFIEIINEGSFGVVFKSKDKNKDRYFAIKKIKRKIFCAESEFRILKKIKHPNIINLFEIVELEKKFV